MIRKECHVTPAVMRELRKTIDDNGILKEDDAQRLVPDRVGRQKLEVLCGKDHISFITSKIIYYLEDRILGRRAAVQGPGLLTGLLLFGAKSQIFCLQLERPSLQDQSCLIEHPLRLERDPEKTPTPQQCPPPTGNRGPRDPGVPESRTPGPRSPVLRLQGLGPRARAPGLGPRARSPLPAGLRSRAGPPPPLGRAED